MKNFKTKYSYLLAVRSALAAIILMIFGCAAPPDDPAAAGAATDGTPIVGTGRYLYMSSGSCQAGSNTTFTTITSANRVSRINLETGITDIVLADYNSAPATPGDSPVGIAPFDANNVVAIIERSGARRMEKIPKSAYSIRIPFSSDTSTAFTAVLLGMTKAIDGGYVISRTNGTTKIGSSGLTQVPTFMSNNLGGACGTTNNKYSTLAATTFGHMFYGNSAASNNKIGIIKNSGSTCLAGLAAPAATAYPSASVFIPGYDQVIVAYSGNSTATDLNSVYVYSITEDANTASLSAGVKLYDAASSPGIYPNLLYSVSAMAFDSTNNALYISTAISTATTVTQYKIEKYNYDPVNKVLTPSSNFPFYSSSLETKCISGLFIDN